MATDSLTLSVPGFAELRINTRSGRVEVTAEERSDLLIESDAPIRKDKIEVDATGRVTLRSSRGGSGWLEIRCPIGTDVVIGTVSGKVRLAGRIGDARINTVSGGIEVERAESLDARSISASIEVGTCTGSCRLQTKSGRATIGTAGDCHVSTMSGQIRLDDATGEVRAHTASGRVHVGTQGKGDVAVKTLSGAVKVELPPDVHPDAKLRSLSGRPRCDCEPGADCRVAISSLSGRIEVVPSE